jgi:hypothetical protein
LIEQQGRFGRQWRRRQQGGHRVLLVVLLVFVFLVLVVFILFLVGTAPGYEGQPLHLHLKLT